MVEIINDNVLENTVLKNVGLNIVDVYADWCGPCKIMEKTVEKLAIKYSEKIRFYKLNADENYLTAQKYKIRSIPLLLIFKDGTLIDQVVGNQSFEFVSDLIDKKL